MTRKHIKDELIILRRFAVNESDLLITAFGKYSGKISLKAKGSKKIASKFTGKLEPLSRVNAEVYFSGKSYTLTNAIVVTEPPLASDLSCFGTSQEICATLIRTLPNEEPNQEIFQNLIDFSELLKAGYKGEELLIIFQTKYLDQTGHLPEIDNEHLKELSPEALKVIKFYSTERSQRAIKLQLPNNTKDELKKKLSEMIQSSFY